MDPAHPALHLAFAAALAVAALASHATAGERGARRGGLWFAAADAALVAALVLEAAALGVATLGGAMADWLAVLSGLAAEGAGAPTRAFRPPATAVALLHTAAALLALAWPLLALRGARRFFARGRSQVPPWADGAVFAGVALVVGATGHAGAWIDLDGSGLAPSLAAWFTPGLAAGVGAAVLLGWLAFALTRLGDFAMHRACRTLAIAAGAASAGSVAAVGLDWHGAATGVRDAGLAGLAAFVAPCLLALLATHLRLAMNHARDIDHLRDSQRKLKALADVDTLTGLPNRRHFHELASRAVEQTAANAVSTVLLFDVDGLKRVNAALGQVTGDEALAQIGTTLRETLRRRDVAGRIGGDEFAVLLPRTALADATTVIDRIHARVADRQVAPRIAPVRLHVGAAEIRPGQSLAETLRKAELALEAARDGERRKRPAAVGKGASSGSATSGAPSDAADPPPSASASTASEADGARGSSTSRDAAGVAAMRHAAPASPVSRTPPPTAERRTDRPRSAAATPRPGPGELPADVLSLARSLQRSADRGDQPRSESTGQPRDAASAASRGSGSTATGRSTASSNDRSFAESL